MLGILVSLYLGAVSEWIQRRTRAPGTIRSRRRDLRHRSARWRCSSGFSRPPVVEQTRKLFEQMPTFIASWESGIDKLAVKFPALRDMIGPPGEHRTLQAAYGDAVASSGSCRRSCSRSCMPRSMCSPSAVMAIYLSLHPALYREWLIALFPPIHRDLVRDVLADLGDSLRAYIVGQVLTMTFLGAITALGLFLLDVPFSLPFGIFTGLVAIVPFFGTLLSTTLPALFVLTGSGYHGFSPFGHALLVVGLGVVVHLIEGNVVSPLVMSKKVDLPPVLTIMSVLVIGQLLGGLGLIVALPTLVALMVIVRRILITRIYEGQGFRRTSRERPIVLRVPAPGGGVIAPLGPPLDVVSAAEKSGHRRSF